jgi:hypothetical protein
MLPSDDNAIRRLEAKTAVTDRLLAGDLTPLQAAAWFRYLDATYPMAIDQASPSDAEANDAEYYCRQALRWAAAAAERESPSRAESLRRSLEDELKVGMRGGNPIELPAVP